VSESPGFSVARIGKVYRQHFGLLGQPFSIMPDPACVHLGSGHQAAAAMLQHAIGERHGFFVLTGEAGTGKTTLLRSVIAQLREDIAVAYVVNPLPQFGSLLGRILLALGIEASDADPLQMIDQFHLLIAELASAGHRVLIVIDEGQVLGRQQMEELRMLSNVGEGGAMPQIVLAGQPALRNLLRADDLTQLAQRVVGECDLRPFDRDETRTYIEFRLRHYGAGERTIFDPAACAAVFEFSRGVPRLINILCEDALIFGGITGRSFIDAELVAGLARDRQRGGILPIGRSNSAIGNPVQDGTPFLNRAAAM
jgi:general secretion pathway protein A